MTIEHLKRGKPEAERQEDDARVRATVEGVLADIAARIGGSGGNIIEVSHQRLFDAPSVQAAELELMVEARDPAHADAIMRSLAGSYVVRRM